VVEGGWRQWKIRGERGERQNRERKERGKRGKERVDGRGRGIQWKADQECKEGGSEGDVLSDLLCDLFLVQVDLR